MKIQITNELKTRIVNAAANGSIVAVDLLKQIRSNKDAGCLIRGTANYFGSRRKRSSCGDGQVKVKVMITVCQKDITNENFPDKLNPHAPWFNENRTEIEPSTFVKLFKELPEYSEEELAYFTNVLPINSKISVKVYSKMNDFEQAYNNDNYSPIVQYGDSTLHNSCMRHESEARNAADFYVNFAGAKIIVAKDAEENILGRAILWENAFSSSDNENQKISVIDRVYYTHSSVMKMILGFAQKCGVHLKKSRNNHEAIASFTVMNSAEINGESYNADMQIDELRLCIAVPAAKWHKRGAPYMDTFGSLLLGSNNTLILSNISKSSREIASLRSTSGYASQSSYFCPKCGKLHTDSGELCEKCMIDLTAMTVFGRMLLGKPYKYDGEVYLSEMFERGRPKPNLSLYLQLSKLYE